MTPRALVAEDEPLLAQALVAALACAWPALQVLPACHDGLSALARLLVERPQVAFLDIRMPGASGLDVARALAEDWPDGEPAPLVVFVTAHDEFAIQAFEHAAVDYLLKPVTPARLARTVARLQARLAETSGSSIDDFAARLVDAQAHLAHDGTQAAHRGTPAPTAGVPLRHLRAGQGDTVRFVPVDAVLWLQATDKYVNVVTADGEHLLRESLRDLLPRLDASRFVQIHRATVVNLDAVDRAVRDDAGRVVLHLRHRPERLAVSRLHVHRFRAM